MDLQEKLLPCHAVCSSCVVVTLFSVSTYVLIPAGVMVLVEIGYASSLLFLGQLLLAVGAIEWSWLAFRIRQRLLLADSLHDGDTVNAQDTEEQEQQIEGQQAQTGEETRQLHALEDQPLRRDDPRKSYASLLKDSMHAKSYAIAPLSVWMCGGRWYLAAFLLASLGAAISVFLAYALEITVIDGRYPAWRVMVSASVAAAFVSIFCSSLAPSRADAVVLIIYQVCFLVASMDAYLRLQVNFIDSDTQTDPLFIVLVGAIVIIVFRIVSSKVVMQSLLLVLCDVLGLVCIVSPLIAFASLIEQTMNQSFRNQLVLFVLVVLAADVGDGLAKGLQLYWPQTFQYCRHPLRSSEAISMDIEALIISLICGVIVIAVVYLGFDGSNFNLVEVVVLIGAIAIGQWCRQWMAHVRKMAKASTSAFYFPEGSRCCGVLDRTAVFLIAIVVYYPYITHKYL